MELINLFKGRNRDTDMENRFVDTVGEGESKVDCESSPETNMTTCKIGS